MNKFVSRKAFTLIEITLVLGLTLGLAAALIFGMAAFSRGSDRAKCLLNMSNVQKAVRSWSNLNEIAPNTPGIPQLTFPGANFSRLWGSDPNAFLASRPVCPRDRAGQMIQASGSGTAPDGAAIGYRVPAANTIPQIGTAYMICNLAGGGPVAGMPHDPCEIDGVKRGCMK